MPVNLAQWSEVAARSDGATFFHTPAWAEALSAAFPRWRAGPLAMEFGDGNLVIVPLLRYPLLGRQWEYAESMLPGVYGGPIFLRSPAPEQVEQVWRALAALPELHLTGNPFAGHAMAPHPVRGFRLQDRFTHVLDLSAGHAAVEKGYRKGHRADIRAARRYGLDVRLAMTPAEVGTYFEIYQDTLRRWGPAASGFYPRRLFEALGARPEMGQPIRLWLACLHGKAVAGIWVFAHREHRVYWHAATLASHMHLHPSHLLVAAAIEEACREGARWFDFNPSGGHPGVVAFKQGFGAQQLDFHAYRRFTPLGRLYRAFRYFTEHYLRRNPL